MIQRKICKSNRLFLSYTSPIGTCKVSQQQSPMKKIEKKRIEKERTEKKRNRKEKNRILVIEKKRIDSL